MGHRAKQKAERRQARATVDHAMTGMTVTIDGKDYTYDPKQLNHRTRNQMRLRYLTEAPDGD